MPGLAEEYTRLSERWDSGMQKTLSGYADSKRRREWFVGGNEEDSVRQLGPE